MSLAMSLYSRKSYWEKAGTHCIPERTYIYHRYVSRYVSRYASRYVSLLSELVWRKSGNTLHSLLQYIHNNCGYWLVLPKKPGAEKEEGRAECDQKGVVRLCLVNVGRLCTPLEACCRRNSNENQKRAQS